MNVLDLFSGIGGFSLGLERAGLHTVAFCECDPYARRVLAKHWPGVPCYDDVRTLTAARLAADGISVDVVCGGFPCQDISTAGKGAGIDGARSGLWAEYARLIAECRPAWVLVENVPALRGRGADRVLADLEAAGYAWWAGVVGAVHAGAPHRRQRVWIVAHSDADGWGQQVKPQFHGAAIHNSAEWTSSRQHADGLCHVVADADGQRLEVTFAGCDSEQRAAVARSRLDDTLGLGWPAGWHGDICYDRLVACPAGQYRGAQAVPDAAGPGCAQPVGPGQTVSGTRQGEPPGPQRRGWDHWLAEPDVGRVAHGVPARVDRLKCLGNAVVPAIPEMIGRAILQAAVA